MVKRTHSERKNRTLFDRGLAALAGLPYQPAHGYLCPICLRQYALDEVTEDHVPPRSFKGSVLCLTCRTCNSTAGHALDAASLSFRHSLGFLQPTGTPYDARLSLDDTTVNVTITRTPGRTDIAVSERNSPRSLQALKLAMRAMGDGASLNIRRTERHTRRFAETGYLRMAYLTAFAKFGYRLVLQPQWDPVRRQVCEPRSGAFMPSCVYMGAELAEGRYLMFVDSPLSCLGVKIDSALVFLPWEGTDTTAITSWLSQGKATGDKTSTLSGRGPLPWPRQMELRGDFSETHT